MEKIIPRIKKRLENGTDCEDEGREDSGAPLTFLTPEQRVSSGPIFLTDQSGFGAVWGGEPGWSSGENEMWKTQTVNRDTSFKGVHV